VYQIDPNQPFSAPWPATVLSRGYYLELAELEAKVKSGALVPRQN
jgi:hypothetical protein